MMNPREEILDSRYDFLRTDPHLGERIVLLGVGGSYAYGTNTESSDLDIRGIALNSKRELLGFENFEQREDAGTDTVIYGFNKIIKLLIGCNPNTIEILGLRPEDYIIKNRIGERIIQNTHLFLSKKVIGTFSGYANAQLYRCKNNIARYSISQEEKEKHILSSIQHAMGTFHDRYKSASCIELFIDNAENPEFEKEIFMCGTLDKYPLRDYLGLISELQSIEKSYSKIGKRNHKKSDEKLSKHMMHLIRLYDMGNEILTTGKVKTYREKERELYMQIRNGEFLREGIIDDAFWDVVRAREQHFEYASKNTILPDKPDIKGIEEFVVDVNERVILNGENRDT